MITINALVAAGQRSDPGRGGLPACKGVTAAYQDHWKGTLGRLNPRLSILGILLTKVTAGQNFARDFPNRSGKLTEITFISLKTVSLCLCGRRRRQRRERVFIFMIRKELWQRDIAPDRGRCLQMKSKSAEKIKLTSYEDLFSAEDNSVEGTYTTVPLSQLKPFKNQSV